MVNLARSGTARKKARRDEQLSIPQDNNTDSAALAAYIAEMSAELATLAGRGNLPMLAYFLNLARVEAQIYARENGCNEICRER